MAEEIVTNQIGNQILPTDDPDFLSGEETPLEELGQEAPKEESPEGTPPEKTPPEKPGEKKPRPTEHYEAELRRRREREDRLLAEAKQRDDELERLREENRQFKTRKQIEEEQAAKVEESRRKSARPDPDVDPVGAELWDLRESVRQQREILDKQQAALDKRHEAEEQAAQQAERTQRGQAAIKEVQNFLEQDVQRFKEENPDVDFDAADQYVYGIVLKYWTSSGLTPQEAQAVIANTVLAGAHTARLRGKSHASTIVETARAYGWNGQAAKPEGPTGKETQPAAKPQDAAAKIAKIAKAQKLQGLGGKTPAERAAGENIRAMSKEELANLSDDDYIRLKQDPIMGPLLEQRLEELG